MSTLEEQLLNNLNDFVRFARRRLGDPELPPTRFRKAWSKR